MRRLALVFAAMFAAAPHGVIFSQSSPVADSSATTLHITSAVPGMEVEFRVITDSRSLVLFGASLSSRGDTVLARTPARLILGRDTLQRHVVLEVIAGEPWLRVLLNGPTMMESRGSRVDIHTVRGRTSFQAATIRTWPRGS